MPGKLPRQAKIFPFWVAFLLTLVVVGTAAYASQLENGLVVTGMSRDTSWGLYIGQFAFFVGIAASSVMVTIPYYLHNCKQFGRILVFGEFLAVAAVFAAMLFVVVDLGQPSRIMNIVLYASPHAMVFWDMVVLSSYLAVSLLVGVVTLRTERRGFPPPRWTRLLCYASIPLAVSIHTVTAFLFCGLPGRAYWMTAILAARFLASAFAAGSAVLIVLCLTMQKFASFRVESEAIDSLAKIVCYAMVANMFFFLLELFTSFYNAIPSHTATFEYLLFRLDGSSNLAPLMWAAATFALAGTTLLLVPKLRKKRTWLVAALIAVFLSCWMEKGFVLVPAGFTPNPLDQVVRYTPTTNEILVATGICAIGLLVLTLLCRTALNVKKSSFSPGEPL